MEPTPRARHLHFWRRLAATWVDAVIVYGVTVTVLAVGAPMGLRWPEEVVFALLSAGYGTALLARYGQTTGKALLGARIVTADGAPITSARALLREAVGKWVVVALLPPAIARLIAGQGWMPTVFDLTLVLVLVLPLLAHAMMARRTWYDALARTRVRVAGGALRPCLAVALLLGGAALAGAVHGLDWWRQGMLPARLALYQGGRSTAPYARALRAQRTAPIDYVLGLFDRYDIVILGERLHPEASQWEFIYDLVADPRFAARVGHVFTEYGTRSQQAYLDSFLAAPHLNDHEVAERARHLLRNPNVWPTWTNTNFYTYLTRLYRLNCSLPSRQRIRHYLTDQHIVWDGLTAEGYQAFRKGLVDRDHDMAQLVLDELAGLRAAGDPRAKALVVMNYRHAFRLREQRPLYNTAEFLFQAAPGRTANVLLNTDMPFLWAPIAGGAWDAALAQSGNPPLGFDLAGTPFGEDAFDLFYFDPTARFRLRYADVFTGLAFLQPLAEQWVSEGIPGYFDGFADEAMRRARLLGDDYARTMQRLIDTHALDAPHRRPLPFVKGHSAINLALIGLLAPGVVIGLVAGSVHLLDKRHA